MIRTAEELKDIIEKRFGTLLYPEVGFLDSTDIDNNVLLAAYRHAEDAYEHIDLWRGFLVLLKVDAEITVHPSVLHYYLQIKIL